MTLIIEPTEIQAFQTCPRMWAFRYMDNLVSNKPSFKLFLGSAVHAGLEAYYKGEDWSAAYDKFIQDTWANLRSLINPTPDEEQTFNENATLGWQMMAGYVEWAKAKDPEFIAKIHYVEQSFKIPLPEVSAAVGDEAFLAGRFDLVVEDVWGRIWPWDHKTASQFPNPKILRLDAQMSCYAWAAHQLWPDKTIGGVMYSALRKVNPSKARTPVYDRFPIIKTDTEIVSAERNINHMATEIGKRRMAVSEKGESIRGWQPPYPGMHCGWKCRYAPLCLGTELGSDLKEIIDASYTVSEKANWLGDDEEGE